MYLINGTLNRKECIIIFKFCNELAEEAEGLNLEELKIKNVSPFFLKSTRRGFDMDMS